MDLLFKNGIVVTETDMFSADVAVKDGVIAAIGRGLDIAAEEVVDVAGKYILPGALDAHTHLAMPFGSTVSADDYQAGTRAAACGGVTTVFDYPIQRTGGSILDLIHEKQEICRKDACVDYAFHCCITDLNDGAILEEMKAAVEEGITSFKCFLVYKKEKMMVDDGTLSKLLIRAKELGAMINVHAENPDLIDMYTEQFLKEGKTTPWYHYLSRPEFVEAEADKRVIHWASHLDASVYIVHMANKEGLLACIDARKQGNKVYVETCPQYLEFTNDVYKRPDGQNFVCSPPMKGEESREALWKALRDGNIDTVATDHCPFQSSEKDWGKENYTKIPNGCSGVETLYPYILSAANEGKISFERAVQVCAGNPARIFGCTQKGSITIGKDADIVIYDPDKEFTVHTEQMHSDTDHTIWEGKKLHGYPIQTYLRGNLVYKDGTFTGKPGMGNYVKRMPAV